VVGELPAIEAVLQLVGKRELARDTRRDHKSSHTRRSASREGRRVSGAPAATIAPGGITPAFVVRRRLR
jgi:hypothetical protein